jgi:hypothetical protein
VRRQILGLTGVSRYLAVHKSFTQQTLEWIATGADPEPIPQYFNKI